eukprot:11517536-Alexandrium_andersonii.AAC.1
MDLLSGPPKPSGTLSLSLGVLQQHVGRKSWHWQGSAKPNVAGELNGVEAARHSEHLRGSPSSKERSSLILASLMVQIWSP